MGDAPVSECKDCGEPIRWMKNERDKHVPVDPESVDDDEAEYYDPKAGHTLHFKTCAYKSLPDQSEGQYQTELEQGES